MSDTRQVAAPGRTRRLRAIAGLLLALFITAALQAAAKPLTPDDVTLLLVGGATPQKLVSLVQQRGVSFKVTPALVRKFRNEGADDSVIRALKEAGSKPRATAPPGPAQPTASSASQLAAPHPSGAALAQVTPSSAAGKPAVSAAAPNATPQGSGQPTASASGTPGAAPRPALPDHSPPILADPSPAEIQHIIQTFVANETQFRDLRNKYTYHQINKVETVDEDGNVSGTWQQEWDVLYDDNGARIERVTYAPEGTLKGISLTEQDLEAFRHFTGFILTTDQLPDYDVKYLGHVKIDYITAYVFSVRPREIKKERIYFDGVVWVDDRDLQIAKLEGRTVPETRHKQGAENLFPRFTSWREQIDRKFWFPTFTMADDTLYFTSGPVHVKEIIRYTNYKQFKSTVKIRVVGAATDKPKPPHNP